MDYKNGKIYAIRSHQTDQIYIGSTCTSLSKRLWGHKNHYKRYLAGKYPFITSFDIVKFEDAYIELLEEYPCDNKNQLHKREGELIRQQECVNKMIAGRTKKEYYEQNTDRIKEYSKEYYEQNTDRIKEYSKEYREENADKIKEYSKEYREENADKIKEYNKDYYEQNADKIKECNKEYKKQNADKIKEYCKQKYTCECGSIVTFGGKFNHFKSKKHQEYEQNKEKFIIII